MAYAWGLRCSVYTYFVAQVYAQVYIFYNLVHGPLGEARVASQGLEALPTTGSLVDLLDIEGILGTPTWIPLCHYIRPPKRDQYFWEPPMNAQGSLRRPQVGGVSKNLTSTDPKNALRPKPRPCLGGDGRTLLLFPYGWPGTCRLMDDIAIKKETSNRTL